MPGGGKQLNPGQSWPLNMNPGTTTARIWARTKCQFNKSGHGKCETGDCKGLLQCQDYGAPPITLAEYGYLNMDFFDISLVDGFNVPMEFSPTSNGCTRVTKCVGNINEQCPNEFKAPGGWNSPCNVFKTDQYCCYSGKSGPTNYSRYFKDKCPDAFSYPIDDQASTLNCPGGTNYKVVFCP